MDRPVIVELVERYLISDGVYIHEKSRYRGMDGQTTPFFEFRMETHMWIRYWQELLMIFLANDPEMMLYHWEEAQKVVEHIRWEHEARTLAEEAVDSYNAILEVEELLKDNNIESPE